MRSDPVLTLKTALGAHPHLQAMRDEPTLPRGVRLQHLEISPIAEVFKRMCRDLEFDVAEMSITGYLLARVYEKGFTALPVFPLRPFGTSHSAITCRRDVGIQSPLDLEGRTVGARAYTGAASFWTRAVLMHEFGVDASNVSWISAEEEHVPEYRQDAPPNAVYRLGADLNEMFRTGELEAGIGLSVAELAVGPLIPDARRAALAFYRRTGIYQLNHTVVVKDSLLAAHPWLAEVLYDAFQDAKRLWLETQPDLESTRELDLPGGNPFPYGVANNRETLEALVEFGAEQKILPRPYSVEELFPLGLD